MTAGKKTAAFAVFFFIAALLVAAPMFAGKNTADTAHAPAAPDQFELPELDGRPVFLNFYSEDCKICAIIKPDLEKLEAEFGDRIQFAHIDANDPRSEALVEFFDVTALPALFWVNADGEPFDSQTGMINAAALRNSFEGVLFQRGKSPQGMPQMPPHGMPSGDMPPDGMPQMPPQGMPPASD
ncbi:MAG TPA: thioredoxin family protein [bacterium]|nr:thioredoxin family protein [bacterium]